jgi:uncharacterized protein (TIGR02421 family)
MAEDTDETPWERLDRMIRQSSAMIDIFANVSPSGDSFEREKQRFLDGEIDEPDFEYDPLGYDPDQLHDRLASIDIPDTPVGELYRKTIEELDLKNTILEHRGDEDVVRDAARQIYGEPSDELVEYAEQVLEETDPRTGDRQAPVDADEARQVFDVALQTMGMEDWETEYTDKTTISVKASEKTIKVPDERDYEQTEPIRLAIHELLHAARSANGYNQDQDIFGIGVSGYQDTDEGLAIFLEDETGFQDDDTLRKYAARVLVTNNVMEGKSFRETFEQLHEDHGIDEEDAFQYTARGYRSGGFAKDHIYLQGYRKIKEYVEEGGSLEQLYQGKVPLEDVQDGPLDEMDDLNDPEYDHRALDLGLTPLFGDEDDEYDEDRRDED